MERGRTGACGLGYGQPRSMSGVIVASLRTTSAGAAAIQLMSAATVPAGRASADARADV
jgi:hypothetical protein